jgi:hypothetical protein
MHVVQVHYIIDDLGDSGQAWMPAARESIISGLWFMLGML